MSLGILVLRNAHYVCADVQRKDSSSCRVTSFIGNKHLFGAVPNFSPFFAAVGSVLLETYDSLRPVELFAA